MKNKLFIFLLTLGICFTYTSCFSSDVSKIPFFWKEKGTVPTYNSILVYKLGGNEYQFEYGLLIPINSSGHSAYMLENVKTFKKNIDGEYIVNIAPIKKYMGKEGSDYMDMEKVYFFNKREKIKIPDNIKRIKFIYHNKEQIIELPLTKSVEIITLAN